MHIENGPVGGSFRKPSSVSTPYTDACAWRKGGEQDLAEMVIYSGSNQLVNLSHTRDPRTLRL